MCNTHNLVLGGIYPVSGLGKMLCHCFCYSVSGDIVTRVFQAAVEVTLLLWDQCLLVPNIFDLKGTSAPQEIGATVCCDIDYLITVVVPLWRQQFPFHKKMGLVDSHRAFSPGQRLVSHTVPKFADILGAAGCLEGSQLSVEAQSHSFTWRQVYKDHMGGKMTGNCTCACRRKEILHGRI